MADSNQFQTGKLHAVYNPVGKTAAGEPRYRRANFDVLEWSSVAGAKRQTYILPLGNERITDVDINLEIPETDAHIIGREFGFYDLDFFIVEPGGDSSDSWKGLHSFGHL